MFHHYYEILLLLVLLFLVLLLVFFIGGRALTFISVGNLLSVGLMLAFRPMLINCFKNMVAPWFNGLSGSFVSFKNLLTDNTGFLIYAVIWIVNFNILFWIIYIILYFSILKKIKIEHRAINATAGILINFIRMSILGGIIIIMMGTNIFGNKLLSYGVIKNEVPTTSVTHKIFSTIDSNIPFLNVNVTDINTIISLYQSDQALIQSGDELKIDTTYEQCNSTIDKLQMIVMLRIDERNKITDALNNMRSSREIVNNKKIIIGVLQEHSTNNFLDASYMTLIFNSYGNIINLYSEIVQLFDDH